MLAGLLLLAAWLGSDLRLALRDARQLTHAEVGQVLPTTRTGVPEHLAGEPLPAWWQPVRLPFAQRHDIIAQAEQAWQGDHHTLITWFRVPLTEADLSTPNWRLYGARAKAYGPIAVYLDGRRIALWQADEVPWYWAPFWVSPGKPTPSGVHELLVRMEHPAHTRVALSSLWVGPADAIRWRYWSRDTLQRSVPAMGGGAFLAAGLFAFFVWLRGNRDIVFLLFTGLAVVSFVRGLHYYTDLPVDNVWLGWLTVNALYWLILIVHHMQLRIHRARTPRFNAVLHGIVLLVLVLTLPWVGQIPNTPDFSPLVYGLAMVTSPMVAIMGFRLSWGRSREGMLITILVVLGTLFGFNDWALQNNLLGPEHWYLGPYANLANFTVFSLMAFGRYMAAEDAVRQSNEQLARKLKEKEAELHESYERLLEAEQAQVLVKERQRLTQDMHDGLGSSLHTALRAVERGQPQVGQVADILRSCIDDLYLTIDSMEPVQADLLLLLGTLRHRLGARLQQGGVQLNWQVQDVPALPWLDPRRSLHIMRILQEAIVNSVRHSGATQLWLRTREAEGGVCVQLEDNGCGFDVESALAQGGRGLMHQQQRATAIGGRVRWHSTPSGTTLTLWLPLVSTEPLS